MDVAAPRIAVTGVGIVSPFGWGYPAFRRGILSGEARVTRGERFPGSRYPAQLAAEVPDAPAIGTRPRAAAFLAAALAEARAQAGLPDDARVGWILIANGPGQQPQGGDQIGRAHV